MPRKPIFLHVSALMLFLFFIQLHADLSYAATLLTSRGNVTLVKNGKSEKIAIGESINEGQSLKTGDASLAIITLKNGSVLKINANSELIITTANEATLDIQEGSVFAKVKKMGKIPFLIRAKTVTMGVRGTEFFASYSKTKKNKDQDIWMCVKEGQVEVESTETQEKVLVKEGEGVFVSSGKNITPPKPYEWTKKLNWNTNPEKGEIVNELSIDSAYSDPLNRNYD